MTSVTKCNYLFDYTYVLVGSDTHESRTFIFTPCEWGKLLFLLYIVHNEYYLMEAALEGMHNWVYF